MLCSPQEIDHSAWRIGQSVLIKSKGIQFFTLCTLRLALCDLLRLRLKPLCGLLNTLILKIRA
jgi:hypothetical protein